MPSWRIHLKWARCYGIREEIAEFANRLIDEPQNVSALRASGLYQILRSIGKGHDWGKKSKSLRGIQKAFIRQLYGEEGVIAVELHHLLDYIAYLCDPRKLAREEVFKKISQGTAGIRLPQRIEVIREVLRNEKVKEKIKELAIKYAEHSPNKDFIIKRLEKKASEEGIRRSVLRFAILHLNEILADIRSDSLTNV